VKFSDRVQRAEKLSAASCGAGAAARQSKFTSASSRTSTGAPARSRLAKYSPRHVTMGTGVGVGPTTMCTQNGCCPSLPMPNAVPALLRSCQ
jgi:hypothetical protein